MWRSIKNLTKVFYSNTIYSILYIFTCIIAGIFFVCGYNFYFLPVHKEQQAKFLHIEKNSSFKKIVLQLHKQQILDYPNIFAFFTSLHGKRAFFKAGKYVVEANTTGKQLLDKLVSGDVIRHNFTIIEGWSLARLLREIKNSPYFQHTLSEEDVISEITEVFGILPEGYFFPDTYSIEEGILDIDFLRIAHKKMRIQLDNIWQNRADNLPYDSPYIALTIASIIEKEAKDDADREFISAVILNRLKKMIRLQMDSTVCYAVDGYLNKCKLNKKSLAKISPYNTYLIKGIPPTPISFPSLRSLEAALHPADSDAIYFVVDSECSSKHVFSDNYAEHRSAVAKYRQKLSEQAD